jgi:osmotically-inducible protein OsmY
VTNWIAVVGRPASNDIQQRIVTALSHEFGPGGWDITVETHGRAVILKGTVRSFPEKHAAERAAMAAPGVHSVTNQIDVAPDL